jgi:hypothetical protein
LKLLIKESIHGFGHLFSTGFYVPQRRFATPRDLPAHDSLKFDHATWCLRSYSPWKAICIEAGVTPEFRSTREGRQSLVDFATDLEILPGICGMKGLRARLRSG